MLVFGHHGLIYFAVPKTGSTSFEYSLDADATLVFRNPPELRHMNVRRFEWHLVPLLRRTGKVPAESMAVLREPRARLFSYYKMRKYDAKSRHRREVAPLDFDAFVEATLRPDPPDFARIGHMDGFLSDAEGRLAVNHLFAVERPEPLLAFLADRFGREIAFDRMNVRPEEEYWLDPSLEQRLIAARSREFALYRQVREVGHLKTGAPVAFSALLATQA